MCIRDRNKVEEAKAVIKKLIDKHHFTLISLGNGTASRESEQLIGELLKEIPVKVQYIIVNEEMCIRYRPTAITRTITPRIKDSLPCFEDDNIPDSFFEDISDIKMCIRDRYNNFVKKLTARMCNTI